MDINLTELLLFNPTLQPQGQEDEDRKGTSTKLMMNARKCEIEETIKFNPLNRPSVTPAIKAKANVQVAQVNRIRNAA